MKPEIRVMLCDDSAIMRRLIRSSLLIEPSLKVVCEATDGRDAVNKYGEFKPEIIVMDVEMPVMDGVEAVRELRKRGCKVPIIMFSSLTSRGAEASLDAIAAGATDFATKPVGSGHIAVAMESLQRDLIPKLLECSRVRQSVSTPSLPRPAVTGRATEPAGRVLSKERNSVSILAVGVSTGGPQALATLIGSLPKDLPVPTLITQHMPPVFTGLLAERLSAQCDREVKEATDTDVLSPGCIFVAPGDYHMMVKRDRTQVRVVLDQSPPVNSCRPAVDPLFQSVAECYGKNSLGVVLTGMGQDGANGAKSLHDCGGTIVVQDRETSVVWGMPGEVVKRDLADRILPIDQIGGEVSRMIQAGRSARPAAITQ
ncbi:MAG: chemotaxis response regulator protein-glutamate methylesterase [Planctomycetota bacterium]